MTPKPPLRPPPKPAGEPPPAAEEPAERALRRLLRTEREAMERQLGGLLSAADPEPLHDFRVALRRARSLLRELGEALPGRAVERLSLELEWLGQATGPSRDLDVMAADLEGRTEALPGWVLEGIKPLFAILSAQRERARKELAEVIQGERLPQLMAALGTLSERRPAASRAPAAASRPIGDLAAERLRKAARRVSKRGQAVGPNAAAAEIHRLRIACKRLRYLLEFFRALYPPRLVAALIGALKELQDLLGASHDLAVQQNELRGLAPELVGEGAGVENLLALGFLLARLEAEERQVEAQICPALRAFLGRRNQERLRRLTGAEEPR